MLIYLLSVRKQSILEVVFLVFQEHIIISKTKNTVDVYGKINVQDSARLFCHTQHNSEKWDG